MASAAGMPNWAYSSGYRGTTIRIFPDDIEPILEENKLALDYGRMAGVQVGHLEAARIVGVNQSVVRDLGREGILPPRAHQAHAFRPFGSGALSR
jgi:hypothetical protein